jgi:hypothetical protein
MNIIQQPDALSLSRNLKPLVIGSSEPVSFEFKKGEDTLLSQRYEPGDNQRIEIDLREIIHAQLSCDLKESGESYEQTNLAADFTAIIDGSRISFRVVKAGVDRLADTPTNFLTENFLTWQPNVKRVTYSSPEFLTYYAVEDSTVKLKAVFTDSNETITFSVLESGKAWTMNLQYANVVKSLNGRFPAYYDVWVENASGQRMTYIQRYQAETAKSIHEDWVLFENSLGGIDTFRAYGTESINNQHTHNIAELDEEYVEYRVDTERLHTKNTGYLTPEESRWLVDFFPAGKKYIYLGDYLRSIVVTESEVQRDNKLVPTSYSFTYKYADARPLLNLPRTDEPADMLELEIPEVGNFTIPPRLAEVPRLPLSEGDLFPVQNPYSETWSTTTTGALASVIGQILSAAAGDGGGIGHSHANIDLLNKLSYTLGYLLVNSEKIKAGYADEAGKVKDGVYIRKDQPDQTEYLVKFLSGIEFGNFVSGLLGTGGAVQIDDDGCSHAEFDYLTIRKVALFIELIIQEAKHVGGMLIVSPSGMTISKVEETNTAYRCYFERTDGDRTLQNQFTVGTQARRQTFNLTNQAYYWRLVTEVGDDYVDLSKTDCDTGSTIPLAGDELVGLGHRTDKTRQSAIIISAFGTDSPSIKYYQGIDSYNLVDKAVKMDYYDPVSGRYKSVTYGDSYIGTKDKSSYIKFEQETGVEVNGRVNIQSGSTGWENMDGLPEEIQQAADLASDAMESADNAAELADGAAQVAADAQDRLDNWASDGVISPTEKLTLKQELSNLQAEYEATLSDAEKYGIDSTEYTSSWNAYKTELEYHSSETPENIEVRPAFYTSQSAFYEARTNLLGTIADKAKDYVDTSINGIGVGSVNLLLNSGFTGNYETENLKSDTPLSENTELYSKSLNHWSGIATVQEDAEAASGRSATIGSLSQSVTLITNESYVISYKAKGTQVAVSCGDFSASQPLTSSYQRCVHKFTFTGTGVFLISGTATICDLQLERGTIATDWSSSPQDNDKSMSKFQTIQYIFNAIKNGSVDIAGGLILANMILVGNYKDGILQKVTAGISGVYNDDDDVFAFGGGSLEQAIYTVMKYKENPMYQPTDEELLNMAKVVITHGGRAILNDVIVRGYIYALGGFFRGKVETFANGNRIVIDPTTNSLAMYDSSDTEVCKLCFRESGEYGSYPELTLTRKNKSGDVQSVSVYGTNVIARNEHSNGDFEQGVLTPLGIEFFRQNDSGTGQDTAAQYLATPAARVISEATYVQPTDEFLRFTPTAGITAYMPEPSKYPGKKYYIKLTSGSVLFSGGKYLNAKDWEPSDTYELTETIAIMLISDGMVWNVFYCG